MVDDLLDIDGVVTAALHQSSFGAPYPKPTRIVGRFPGFESDDRLNVGRPHFS